MDDSEKRAREWLGAMRYEDIDAEQSLAEVIRQAEARGVEEAADFLDLMAEAASEAFDNPPKDRTPELLRHESVCATEWAEAIREQAEKAKAGR